MASLKNFELKIELDDDDELADTIVENESAYPDAETSAPDVPDVSEVATTTVSTTATTKKGKEAKKRPRTKKPFEDIAAASDGGAKKSSSFKFTWAGVLDALYVYRKFPDKTLSWPKPDTMPPKLKEMAERRTKMIATMLSVKPEELSALSRDKIEECMNLPIDYTVVVYRYFDPTAPRPVNMTRSELREGGYIANPGTIKNVLDQINYLEQKYRSKYGFITGFWEDALECTDRNVLSLVIKFKESS